MGTRILYADLSTRRFLVAEPPADAATLAPFYVGDSESIIFSCFYQSFTGTSFGYVAAGITSGSLALGFPGSAPLVSTTAVTSTAVYASDGYTQIGTNYAFTLSITGTSASTALGSSDSVSVMLEFRPNGGGTIQSPATLKRRLNF